MPKKILIKEAGFIDFIKSFFKAKESKKEKEWISRLKKVDPEVGDAWKKFDDSSDALLNNLKKVYQDMNMPEAEKAKKIKDIDDIIKKYS
jgi:hypothetical protein